MIDGEHEIKLPHLNVAKPKEVKKKLKRKNSLRTSDVMEIMSYDEEGKATKKRFKYAVPDFGFDDFLNSELTVEGKKLNNWTHLYDNIMNPLHHHQRLAHHIRDRHREFNRIRMRSLAKGCTLLRTDGATFLGAGKAFD